ncbi:NAD(P)-dependent oxidoreductase [Acuticoccus sp. MNP-M23]|uniref:NAD(P)-dependent oxidoreductase n=1 Tax=Acuticoccus sp. MNP-M23 TaxID=3072793 RepID=UPI002816389D|nr:NAD(P)-dependent oxidoreductase [Acuticoccus sp. MNP-M23]WMS41521.1 NAD(P)-dependent oxidoreductase [Acuticoccus sp. MNP-M23]
MTTIGFVGAGMMGEGMASCALKGGQQLVVTAHRNRAGVERLVAAGALEVPDLETLAREADVIVLCVSDAPAVEAVLQKLDPGLRENHLIIDTSTSDPVLTRRLADGFAERGIGFADAPIAGGPPEAAAGKLATLLGADAPFEAKAREVVALWSAHVEYFGAAGTAHTAKLINNYVTQGMVLLLAEAFTTARHAGVDWDKLHGIMQRGAARSGTLEKVVPPALAGDFDGHAFSMANSAKDARYYAELSEAITGKISPLAAAVAGTTQAAVDAGFGDLRVSRRLEPAVADKLG